jgi:Rad3-related DNA helicase
VRGSPPTPQDIGLDPAIFPSFREGQVELATRLVLSPARFPELNAACGSGKSLIYYTASLLFDLRLLIITPQKALQDQLVGDFGPPHGDLVDVRGQSNYECPHAHYHNCEIGAANECPLRRLAEDHPQRCPNMKAIDRARKAKRVVTNHAFWMTQGKAQARSPLSEGSSSSLPPPGIGSFDLIVLDEGHHTPERLADFCSLDILEKEMDQLLDLETPSSRTLSVWSEWARAASLRIPDAMKMASSPRERFRLLSIGRDLTELSGVSEDKTTEWIYQHQQLDGKHTFSPVWATSHAESLLFQGTPKILLTSATLLPSIGKYLGISPEDEEYIDVMSGFDPQNRPFIYTPSGVSVSYKSTASDHRVLMSKYDQIIDLWRGYKGLFHTQSYDLQTKLLSSSRNRHRFIVCERGSGGLSGAKAIDILKSSQRDMIAVGPGLKEGFDLSEDSARFQIIAKMPLVNRTDPVVDARCKAIPQYSTDQVVIGLMQAHGRIVRSRKDWGYTYTSDKQWSWVRKSLPESFRVTERWENERVPGPPKEKR